MRRRASLRDAIAVAAALEILTPLCADAENWPARPMTMVVPFTAGGTADPIGRVLAAGLSQVLGQQVIVENVGGGGGTLGTNRVVKGAPDGYQFVFGTNGSFVQSQALSRHPLYNTLTDLVPVALVAQQPVVLVARKDFPADNLRDFIAYAKAHQTEMQFGSPGIGSGNHFACMLLNAAIGLTVTHVPYRGGSAAMQDLIGGRLDYQCPNDVLAGPLVTSGAIKGIAVLSRQHSTALPGLATAHEQGLADFDVSTWFALALPRNVPTAIVRKLNEATIAALRDPALQGQMRKIGADLVAPDRQSPDDLAKFFASEIARWTGVIKTNGLALD